MIDPTSGESSNRPVPLMHMGTMTPTETPSPARIPPVNEKPIKVEMMSDDTYTHLYLKVSLQSRFWETDAQRFGEALCKATGMHVELERTQSDGIITYSMNWDP